MLVFDDSDPLMISNFVVKTENGSDACVMRAVDVDRHVEGLDSEVLGKAGDPIEATVVGTVSCCSSLFPIP